MKPLSVEEIFHPYIIQNWWNNTNQDIVASPLRALEMLLEGNLIYISDQEPEEKRNKCQSGLRTAVHIELRCFEKFRLTKERL